MQATMSLHVGDAAKALGATADPADADDAAAVNSAITYTSDNEGVATVDAAGKVTAVAEGTANITATSGDLTASTKVTVAAAA